MKQSYFFLELMSLKILLKIKYLALISLKVKKKKVSSPTSNLFSDVYKSPLCT